MACAPKSHAISFNLDSIAEWGKFARFCVNTYRWGDRFFNTRDTAYVVGTGTKFNIKLTSDFWADQYRFDFVPHGNVNMFSDVASNIGLHLTYMAVSVGYDMNINKFFNGYESTRKRINFAFNCQLFGAEFYINNNDITTNITSISNGGQTIRPHVKFDGISNDRWGFDIYYFLNNKRYSQAAAFSYSKLQRRSQGSWYFGLSFCNQRYNFEFSRLPQEVLDYLPKSWDTYNYGVNTNTFSIKAGYGYNWVLGPHWLLAISESPTVGYRTGHVNSWLKNSLGINNILRFSAVYNYKHLFLGMVGHINTSLVRDPESTLVANVYLAEFSIGYRFNLW